MTKLTTPGKYAAQMSRAGRKSRGSTSAKRKAALERVTVKMCEECGQYPADSPSTICVGCEAYREHQWS